MLHALLWLVATLTVVVLALRWVDTDQPFLVAAQAMVPTVGFVAAAALAVALVAALVPALSRAGRRGARGGPHGGSRGAGRGTRLVAVVLAACCTVYAILAVPTLTRSTVPPEPGDVRVLSANLYKGHADAAALMAQVREREINVLVLVEVTPEMEQRLEAAGLRDVLPYEAGMTAPSAAGIRVWTGFARSIVDNGWGTAASQPTIRIGTDHGEVLLRAVHPEGPTLQDATTWRQEQRLLQRWVREQSGTGPLVVAGDFNASASHPAFRATTEGLQDAARVAGRGFMPTWPTGRTLLRPFTQIDHVMVRGMAVVDAGSVTIPGSDHAAVWARLRIG